MTVTASRALGSCVRSLILQLPQPTYAPLRLFTKSFTTHSIDERLTMGNGLIRLHQSLSHPRRAEMRQRMSSIEFGHMLELAEGVLPQVAVLEATPQVKTQRRVAGVLFDLGHERTVKNVVAANRISRRLDAARTPSARNNGGHQSRSAPENPSRTKG
ncbi:MAG: hypothetical protein A2289_12045 [Deltaproteobacteria bacterium RIFOXYA12_FULL_58_15]|nr:MAG: hypothetical protein A2289_12045 [Deltaproteobacteria bacterium RIFOXYA12_FULL_58_15]